MGILISLAMWVGRSTWLNLDCWLTIYVRAAFTVQQRKAPAPVSADQTLEP